MNRWNEFYDRMTPKKNYLKNTQANRKPETTTNTITSLPGKLKNRITGAVGESYMKRRDDVGTISHQADTNNTNNTNNTNDSNFAWVD